MINDRHEIYQPYVSKCGLCQHFDRIEFTCSAFPNGIPDVYLKGEKHHTGKVKGQVGSFVFKSI